MDSGKLTVKFTLSVIRCLKFLILQVGTVVKRVSLPTRKTGKRITLFKISTVKDTDWPDSDHVTVVIVT